jgi:hypothetical protein
MRAGILSGDATGEHIIAHPVRAVLERSIDTERSEIILCTVVIDKAEKGLCFAIIQRTCIACQQQYPHPYSYCSSKGFPSV